MENSFSFLDIDLSASSLGHSLRYSNYVTELSIYMYSKLSVYAVNKRRSYDRRFRWKISCRHRIKN